MRELLRHRDARIYLPGQILSSLGDSALWLAMALWTRMLTGSTSEAGFVVFALTLGVMFSPLGGLIVDRVRRRPLLIAANLAVGAFVLLLLLVHGRDRIWLIYVVMLGYGLSAGVIGAAQSALVKTMIPESLLGDANGVMQTAQQGMRLVAPLLGAGVLAAFGPTPVIVGDAATFLLAALSLLLLKVPEERPAPTGEPWLGAMTAGVRFIRRTVELRQLTIAGILMVAGFGLGQTMSIAIVTQGLHRPVELVGVLSSTLGVGAILSGAASAAVMRRVGEVRLAGFGLLCALLAACLQMAPSLPAVLAGCALEGASLPWFLVGIGTLFQRRTPSELMGRAGAALAAALSVPQTVMTAVGAALIAVLEYRYLLAGTAAFMAIAAAYLITRPQARAHAEPTAETKADTLPRSADADVGSGPQGLPDDAELAAVGAAVRSTGDGHTPIGDSRTEQ